MMNMQHENRQLNAISSIILGRKICEKPSTEKMNGGDMHVNKK